MIQITEPVGKQLIARKEAGFWATYANPPIPHDTQIVVHVGGRWFLAQVPADIQLIPKGRLEGTNQQIHLLESENELLCELVRAEVENRPAQVISGVKAIDTRDKAAMANMRMQ